MLIFDEKELCRLAFCVSIEENAGATLLSGADCTVVLVSSGRAAVTANSEPVLLTAGQGQIVWSNLALGIKLEADCFQVIFWIST